MRQELSQLITVVVDWDCFCYFFYIFYLIICHFIFVSRFFVVKKPQCQRKKN